MKVVILGGWKRRRRYLHVGGEREKTKFLPSIVESQTENVNIQNKHIFNMLGINFRNSREKYWKLSLKLKIKERKG